MRWMDRDVVGEGSRYIIGIRSIFVSCTIAKKAYNKEDDYFYNYA
jgi:hypothetical protein